MYDARKKIEELGERFRGIEKTFNLEDKKYQLDKLTAAFTDPNLWDDQEKAKSLMQSLGDLKKEIEEFEGLRDEIKTLTELSKDPSLAAELSKEVEKLEKNISMLELHTYLSGPYDEKNAIVSIHAGQGGTEAMDWANMLYRMYVRFCEGRAWKVDVVDQTQGEEAGIKSITFKVEGKFAHGYLKGEAGTHRLVRQSPFNADRLRQTSFALVEVLPEFSEVDLPDIEIKEDDLEWEFMRSSSQGGQNVQKVSTAVRLKHIPTGVVVTAQSERFQEQNRKIALSHLRAKLWALAQEKAQRQKENIKGEYKPASWGNQIRSYVLHPYKMVKDLRTKVETSNTEAILDGEIDQFIEAELRAGV